jgi:hypothetical protein
MGKLTGTSSLSLETVTKATNAEEFTHGETAPNSSATPVLSRSMIKAVNNAAETARLVMEQAATENKTDDGGSGHPTHPNSNSRGGGSNIFFDISEASQGGGKLDNEPQSIDSGTPFTPPPNAFHNLPMSRHVAPFHKATVDVADVLVEGAEFHVTDHFDAAAAISAALASSHLADAAGSVGMLQMPHPNTISKRRTVGDSNQTLKPLRTAQYVGEANCVLVMTALDDGGKVPRSRSSGLPTPEEAEARMLSNRDSFTISLEDDASLGNNSNSNFALKALSNNQQTLGTDCEQLNNKNIENNGYEGMGLREPQVISPPEILEGKLGAGFDNESNTSSVDGSNSNSGYFSDFSPISMSTGDSGTYNQNGGNSANKSGMLRNLAKTRRAAVEDSYEGHYDVEDDDYSTNSDNSVLRVMHSPQGRNVNVDAKKSAALQSTHNFAGDESATADNVVTPAGPLFQEKQSHLNKRLSVEQYASVHQLALFSSFDRKWDDALQGSDNSVEVVDLGKKCFAAFASIPASGRSIFGETFRWWVDFDALPNSGDIAAKEKEDHHRIPIAVVRTFWRACFFDAEEDEDSVNCILDSIQHALVKDLCYLTPVETPVTTCLQLSSDVYAEYGCYILHRFSLQHHVALWHSRFALKLRQLLLNSSLTDADCEYVLPSSPQFVMFFFR